MGRTGQPRAVRPLHWTLVAVLGASPALLVGCGSSLSAAATTLGPVSETVVATTGGHTVVATLGMRLQPGDVVRTGTQGGAELLTAHRVVSLASGSVVRVVNGSRQQVLEGSAVVDAQRGSPLTVDVSADQVTVPGGAATTIDRSPVVRVGSLVGSAALRSATGRRLVVPALHQAVAAGDAVPSQVTPLHLLDDAGEARAVPGLVADDETLDTLAAGLQSASSVTTTAVAASWHGSVAAQPAETAVGERLLPIVIADGTGRSARQQRYDEIVGWRAQGGSWGVILHLLGGTTGAVFTALDAVESGRPGQLGTLNVAELTGGATTGNRPTTAGGGGDAGTHHGHHASRPPAAGGTTSSTSGGGSSGSGGGGSGGGSRPSPAPNPTSSPVGTVTKTIGTVLSILPTKLPSPVPLPTRLP